MHHRFFAHIDLRRLGPLVVHGKRIAAIQFLFAVAGAASIACAEETNPAADALSPDVWRQGTSNYRSAHAHRGQAGAIRSRAVGIMDAAGVGVGIELGSGTVTPIDGNVSQFEQVKRIADSYYPGRFLCYMLLDYKGWDEPEWSQRG